MTAWRDDGEHGRQRPTRLINTRRRRTVDRVKDALPQAEVLRIKTEMVASGELVTYAELAGGDVVMVAQGRVTAMTVAHGDMVFGERPRTNRVAISLVRAALGLLGHADRERYAEEWSADFADQHGRKRQLSFGLGTLYSALHLALQQATSATEG